MNSIFSEKQITIYKDSGFTIHKNTTEMAVYENPSGEIFVQTKKTKIRISSANPGILLTTDCGAKFYPTVIQGLKGVILC